jgi:hypothetical protein
MEHWWAERSILSCINSESNNEKTLLSNSSSSPSSFNKSPFGMIQNYNNHHKIIFTNSSFGNLYSSSNNNHDLNYNYQLCY